MSKSSAPERRGEVARQTPEGADEVLARRAAGGDAEAFEALVLRYQDRVYNLLVRLCGSETEAEDLAQETFLKAYRGLSSFRHGSRFYTWLFRIAVNAGYSRGRQWARRQRVEGVRLDAPAMGGEAEKGATVGASLADQGADDPSKALERRDLQTRVQEGLAQLDPDYRTVLLLRDMEGLDYDAIAEALALSRSAVKSRLHRARLELAGLLKDLRPGEGKET